MRSLAVIVVENVRRFVRNRSFFIVALAAPFAIMAVLSATIGPALSGEFRPSIVIVDDGDADAAIIYPEEILTAGADRADITVLADAGSSIARDVARSIAESSADRLDTVRVLSVLDAPTDDLRGPLQLVDGTPIGDRVLTDGTYFAVGMSAYFAFFAAISFVATIHQERRQSTWARTLVAPIDRSIPLAGKGLAAGLTALASSAVLVVSSTALLDADWGPAVGVAIVVVALVFAAVGVALAVASVTRSEESATEAGTALATAWAIFGGVFVVIPATGVLDILSRLSPFRWTLDAIGLNAGAGDLADVASCAVAIAAFGAVGLAVAAARRGQLMEA